MGSLGWQFTTCWWALNNTPPVVQSHESIDALLREGQGYQMIKDALRRDVAVEFLIQPNLPLPQVVTRVGFSEASTFYGAFKG